MKWEKSHCWQDGGRSVNGKWCHSCLDCCQGSLVDGDWTRFPLPCVKDLHYLCNKKRGTDQHWLWSLASGGRCRINMMEDIQWAFPEIKESHTQLLQLKCSLWGILLLESPIQDVQWGESTLKRIQVFYVVCWETFLCAAWDTYLWPVSLCVHRIHA